MRLLTLVVLFAVAAAGCDWAQFRYGSGHGGWTPDSGVEVGSVPGLIDFWSATTGSAIDSSPSVVGNRVFVGSHDGSLYAFGARTGTVLWSAATGGPISSSPAVAGGTVYVGSDDHTLRAFAEADGAPAWTVSVDATFGGLGSVPHVVGGKVYVASALAVYAYDATTGALSWSTPVPTTGALSAPALAGSRVYVASYLDARVWSLNSTTGAIKWTTTIPGPRASCGWAMSSPAVISSTLYVALCPPSATPLQSAYAINTSTGSVVWSGGSARHSTSPAVFNNTVYFGSGSGQLLEALATSNGSTRWKAPMGAAVVSSPSIAQGVLYIGSDAGKLSAFDAAGVQGCGVPAGICNPLWTTTTGGPVRSSPAIADRVIYVGSDDGVMRAYTLPSVAFSKSALTGSTWTNPTIADFGPDGRLYVAQRNGVIKVHTIDRVAPNDYRVTATESITLVRQIPNHDDDGSPNPTVTDRLITGLLLGGSAADPVLYVSSSDPRMGGGATGQQTNLDTNSGIVSRVTRVGMLWQRQDLVRGLPRSEENHATNAIVRDAATNTLYVGQGGHTNMGAPSHNFNFLPEYAYSAAVLSIDLNAIGTSTYDLPTLVDEDHPTNTTPFGGNGGKHQARIDPGGPVQVYAPGYRNPFAVVLTRAGNLFAIDNGANGGWGDVPINEGPLGNCTNDPHDPGVKVLDSVHRLTGPGQYGGHPNPTRANMLNTFNPTNPQSPVVSSNPIECDYRAPGSNGSIATLDAGTTGADEYTTANLANQLDGDLLVASIKGSLLHLDLNPAGTSVLSSDVMFSDAGVRPVDVVAAGANDPFPGTIWVVDYTGAIRVFEPADFDGVPPQPCGGSYSAQLDEDLDGYSNADELDNATDPCSPGDAPHDWNRNFVSDLNDPDDDSDLVPDISDPFPIDPDDGLTTPVPIAYSWQVGAPGNPCAPTPVPSGCPGGLLGLGFTGTMADGVTNYTSRFNPANMTAGGAAGVLSVAQVPPGDALGAANTQQYAFLYGINTAPATTPTFTVRTRLVGPFAGISPNGNESAGVLVGTGDQDNYAKVVISANSGSPQVTLVVEIAGSPTTVASAPLSLVDLDALDLYLTIDPTTAIVQARFGATVAGVGGSVVSLGAPTSIPPAWLASTTRGLAIGVIATSANGVPFAITWSSLEATLGVPS